MVKELFEKIESDPELYFTHNKNLHSQYKEEVEDYIKLQDVSTVAANKEV